MVDTRSGVGSSVVGPVRLRATRLRWPRSPHWRSWWAGPAAAAQSSRVRIDAINELARWATRTIHSTVSVSAMPTGSPASISLMKISSPPHLISPWNGHPANSHVVGQAGSRSAGIRTRQTGDDSEAGTVLNPDRLGEADRAIEPMNEARTALPRPAEPAVARDRAAKQCVVPVQPRLATHRPRTHGDRGGGPRDRQPRRSCQHPVDCQWHPSSRERNAKSRKRCGRLRSLTEWTG